MANLLTEYEVIKYSPAGRTYPTSYFCQLIPQVEETFVRDCLGKDLYDYIVSKLAEYPADAKEWDCDKRYSLGDKVIANGCLFTSTANFNTSDPLEADSDWDLFARFTDEEVDSFWRKYLRNLLALMVYRESLVFTTYQSTAGGILVQGVDTQGGVRSAGRNELGDLRNELTRQIQLQTDNMKHWLKNNATTAGFPASNFCSGDLCETPAKSARRWAFAV